MYTVVYSVYRVVCRFLEKMPQILYAFNILFNIHVYIVYSSTSTS